MVKKLENTSLALTAIGALTRWLEEIQVPYTTIGGLAVALVAQPRVTEDIDITVWLEEGDWAEFVESGRAYGFTPRTDDAIEFARRSRVLLLQHRATDETILTTKLDVSLAAMPFEQEMIERAKRTDDESLRLVIPTPEDLIIMKAVAHRPKDAADIEAILNVHPDFDHKRVRNWLEQFVETLEMPELLDDFERLLQRVQSTNKGPASKSAAKKKTRTKK